MAELNEAGAGAGMEIETAGRHRANELSPSALAYIALALSGVLAFVWFVAATWVFGLVMSR